MFSSGKKRSRLSDSKLATRVPHKPLRVKHAPQCYKRAYRCTPTNAPWLGETLQPQRSRHRGKVIPRREQAGERKRIRILQLHGWFALAVLGV